MAQNSPTSFLVTANDLIDYDLQWSPAFKQAFSFILNEEESPLRFESIDLQSVTKVIQKPATGKRSYINVSNELRFKLIEAVHKNGETVKYASKKLGINYSSAKVICQIYKKEGRSERRLARRRDYFEPINKRVSEQVLVSSPLLSLSSKQVSYPDKDSEKLLLSEERNPSARPDELKNCLLNFSSSSLIKESPFSDKLPFHNSELSLPANLRLSTETEVIFKAQGSFRNGTNNVSMTSVLEQSTLVTILPGPQNMPAQNLNIFTSQIVPFIMINSQPQPQLYHLYKKGSCAQHIPILLQNGQYQQMEAYNIQDGNIISNGFPRANHQFYILLPQTNYIPATFELNKKKTTIDNF